MYFPKTKEGEKRPSVLFGVELEMSVFDEAIRKNSKVHSDYCGGVNLVRTLVPDWWEVVPEGIRGRNGTEIQSQPCSLPFWMSERKTVRSLLKSLHGVSITGNIVGAGMHIHMTDALKEEHNKRLCALVYMSGRQLLQIGGRTSSTMAEWSNFMPDVDWSVVQDEYDLSDRFGEDEPVEWGTPTNGTMHPKNMDLMSMLLHGDIGCGPKGAPICCRSIGTLECRWPTGSFDFDQFYGNLETVAAMIEFTHSHTRVKELTWNHFKAWLLERRSPYYRELHKIIGIADVPKWVRYSRDTRQTQASATFVH